MKKMYILLCLGVACILSAPAFAVNSAAPPPSREEVKDMAETAKKEWKELSRQEKKAKRQELKAAIKEFRQNQSDTDLLLLVIIAILLPPLAMALYDGITNRFWISLLLTLLFYVPGLIYTLVIILGGK
jgi:uncharacterized membrane protein YqaE (UPF0057 family)